jgi:hypothetical protein
MIYFLTYCLIGILWITPRLIKIDKGIIEANKGKKWGVPEWFIMIAAAFMGMFTWPILVYKKVRYLFNK